MRTGDEVSLVFRAAAPVAACQFTLEFPALELLDLTPGPGLTPDHFAVFPAEHALTASLDNEAAPAAFTVRFRAQADGRLSQLLAFSDRITRRSAVRLNGAAGPENLDLALRFAAQDAAGGFLLYPNTPNPWTDWTRIGFYLPAPAALTLRVYDATGRPVWVQQGSFEAGMQQVTVVGADLGAPGVYYYALETPWGRATGRMCRF